MMQLLDHLQTYLEENQKLNKEKSGRMYLPLIYFNSTIVTPVSPSP